ncbi:class I SAM-dependent RNA methyltransferase [Hyphomicrobium methylovorum]|nr:class I SAM-dependent RNA methyltransferase [Hyphomicrobium methylovorum]
MTADRELTITRLGAQGDGIADVDGRMLFVPFALPGERVLASVSDDRARLIEVIEASPDRIAPVCRHFGVCGGCSVQHLAPSPYRAWKHDLVQSTFRQRGLEIEIGDVVEPRGRRRRAIFSAVPSKHGLDIGFHAAGTHDLVPIDDCAVLEPKIVAALPQLAALIGPLVSKVGARITVTATEGGLDVSVEGTERRLTPDIRSKLALEANKMGLARLVIGGDDVCQMLPPVLKFGTAEVVLPPGAFVQAVAEAEREIAARIVAAVGKVKTVADLFSGLGAFTFPLAQRAKVSAFDGDRAAIAALSAGVRTAKGLKPIAARVRDLFREPLSPLELNEHDAVVFDPPRAGADAQAQRLARSKVKTVVAVSCNPATLARDARHLVDGGYKIESVTPVDQFIYSAHVEVVAIFRR